MDIGINALGAIVATRVYDKAIVGVHISSGVSLATYQSATSENCSPCLINRMVAGSETPGWVATVVPSVAVRLIVGGPWRQTEVHEMGDGRLALPVVEWTHGEGLDNGILVGIPEAFGAFVLLLLLLGIPRRGR